MHGWDDRFSVIFNDWTISQGMGGNISTKNNNQMFIKSSGQRLYNYQKKDFWCKILDIETYRNSFKIDHSEIENGIVIGRPSIESTMHVILKKKYVLHVHELYSLALLCLENPEQHLDMPCIEFVEPGFPIAKQILKHEIQGHDIILLKNHGLIIQSDTTDGIIDLLKIFTTQCREFWGETAVYDKNIFYQGSTIFLNHEVDIKSNWLLYPDHVVICGKSPNFSQGSLDEYGYCFESNNKLLLSKNCSEVIIEQLYLFLNILKISKKEQLVGLSPHVINKIINRRDEIFRKTLIQ